MALLLVTSCSWGLNWPVMKYLLHALPPFSMRCISFIAGFAVALAIALLRRESLRIPRAQIGNLIVFALLNYGLFGIFTALSLFWLRASEAVVITYTLPVWAALLAWPMLGERPTLTRIAGMLIALGGVAFLVGADELIDLNPRLLPGVASGFAAAFLFGLATVVAKRQPLRLPPVAGVAWQIGIGFIPTLILAAFEHPDFARVTPLGWAGFAYIAVMPMTVAYLAWFRALRLLPASIAAIAVLMSPMVGVLSSALLLGDPFGPRQVVALAVTLTGIGLAARS